MIPSDESENQDYRTFQHSFDAFVKKYDIETYDYLYDFMVYVFETLYQSSKRQSKEGEGGREMIYQETFSKSYITIYFFILISNPSLKKHHKEDILENGKKAWLIQCLDDMCDIHQDMKNKIQTMYTYTIEEESHHENKGNSRFEKEMTHLFHKIFHYIYTNTHETHPLLCRTWIYLMMHIQVFLVYKNRKYVSETYVKRYFQNKYYYYEMFESLKVDLFSSTQILVNVCKKWLEE